jgi:tetratricopeptide (TPR) repeat protein
MKVSGVGSTAKLLMAGTVGLLLSAGPLFSAPSQSNGWAIDAVVAASNTLAGMESVYTNGGPAVVKAVAALGKAQMDALEYKSAVKSYSRALALNDRQFKHIKGDFRHALILHVRLISSLADAQMKSGDFENAARNYERGVHVAKLGVGATTPEVKHLRTGLVIATARRSIPATAESLFKQLLASSERASGFVSDDIAMILDNWIELRAYTQRLPECEAMATRLVDVSKRVYGSDHPAVANALARQASIIYDAAKASGKSRANEVYPLLHQQYRHIPEHA